MGEVITKTEPEGDYQLLCHGCKRWTWALKGCTFPDKSERMLCHDCYPKITWCQECLAENVSVFYDVGYEDESWVCFDCAVKSDKIRLTSGARF